MIRSSPRARYGRRSSEGRSTPTTRSPAPIARRNSLVELFRTTAVRAARGRTISRSWSSMIVSCSAASASPSTVTSPQAASPRTGRVARAAPRTVRRRGAGVMGTSWRKGRAGRSADVGQGGVAEAEHQTVRPGEERGGADQIGDLGVGQVQCAQRREPDGRRAGAGELRRGRDERGPALVLAGAQRGEVGTDPVLVACERGG